jgi:hypothetical protein
LTNRFLLNLVGISIYRTRKILLIGTAIHYC